MDESEAETLNLRTPDKQVWAVSFIRQVNKRDLILKAEVFGTASNIWLALRTLPAGHTLDIKSVKKRKKKNNKLWNFPC